MGGITVTWTMQSTIVKRVPANLHETKHSSDWQLLEDGEPKAARESSQVVVHGSTQVKGPPLPTLMRLHQTRRP
jgi:hypothetical protein